MLEEAARHPLLDSNISDGINFEDVDTKKRGLEGAEMPDGLCNIETSFDGTECAGGEAMESNNQVESVITPHQRSE